MNVTRSPSHVLDRAFAEALATFTPEMTALHSLPDDQMIGKLSTGFRDVHKIYSPLQNLSLFRDMLAGASRLADKGVTNASATLMAVFLGAASDKSVTISRESALAVSTNSTVVSVGLRIPLNRYQASGNTPNPRSTFRYAVRRLPAPCRPDPCAAFDGIGKNRRDIGARRNVSSHFASHADTGRPKARRRCLTRRRQRIGFPGQSTP